MDLNAKSGPLGRRCGYSADGKKSAMFRAQNAAANLFIGISLGTHDQAIGTDLATTFEGNCNSCLPGSLENS